MFFVESVVSVANIWDSGEGVGAHEASKIDREMIRIRGFISC